MGKLWGALGRIWELFGRSSRNPWDPLCSSHPSGGTREAQELELQDASVRNIPGDSGQLGGGLESARRWKAFRIHQGGFAEACEKLWGALVMIFQELWEPLAKHRGDCGTAKNCFSKYEIGEIRLMPSCALRRSQQTCCTTSSATSYHANLQVAPDQISVFGFSVQQKHRKRYSAVPKADNSDCR